MKFKQKHFAAEYNTRMKEEGYPGKLLTLLLEIIPKLSRIIDIGAGSGLIAIPLSKAGFQVTAIEPSEEMISLMKTNMGSAMNNLTIIHSDWESWNGPAADYCISVHSIYGISNLNDSLRKMKQKSLRSIIIVRDKTGSKTLTDILRESLKLNSQNKIISLKIRKILRSLHFPFTEIKFIQERTRSFKSILDEANYYQNYFGLTPDYNEQIAELLQKETTHHDDTYSYVSHYHDTIFTF